MKLSIITDEISDDLQRALDVCDDLQIDAVELRSVDGRNLVELTTPELGGLRSALDARRYSVSAVAAPYLKADRGAENEQDVLGRALRAASLLGAPIVRAFSYWREPNPTESFAELGTTLRSATDAAQRAGLRLALENEHECNVASIDELARALTAIGDQRLGVIWDPANALKLDSSAPQDLWNLPSLMRQVIHVHLKDVDENGDWVRVGTGLVDHVSLLLALERLNYDRFVSIETHYQRDGSSERATRDCLASLRDLVERAGVALSNAQ